MGPTQKDASLPGRGGEADPNDTDGDGLDDGTEHDGWTVRTINRSGSAYQWAGPNRDANGTIHADSDPKVTDSDYDGFSDAEEKRRIHTDPSGDVEYGIAFTIDRLTIGRYVTDAADISRDDLFLGRYYFVSDDDEDGIIDEMEEKYGVPTRTEEGYERLYLDPSSPDSDGDGLLDGEEFESERWYFPIGVRVEANSAGRNTLYQRKYLGSRNRVFGSCG